jgi:hypothetical protein
MVFTTHELHSLTTITGVLLCHWPPTLHWLGLSASKLYSWLLTIGFSSPDIASTWTAHKTWSKTALLLLRDVTAVTRCLLCYGLATGMFAQLSLLASSRHATVLSLLTANLSNTPFLMKLMPMPDYGLLYIVNNRNMDIWTLRKEVH